MLQPPAVVLAGDAAFAESHVEGVCRPRGHLPPLHDLDVIQQA